MQEYKICGKVTVSCTTIVRANSEAEALEIANKRECAQFHIDGTYSESNSWHMDNDGTPYDTYVED